MKNLSSLLLAAIVVFPKIIFSQDYDIYVSDAGNFSSPPWQILKYDQNGENGQVFISENLGWPQDILFLEEQNRVLISNLNTDSVNSYNSTTGEFQDLFAAEADGPTRMQFGPDGHIYILQWFGNGKVLRYDVDGTYLGEFTETGVSRSIGMAWDEEGNLYVSSYNQSTVRKFSPTGEDLGLFISSGINGPTNIWFDETGNFFVNNYNANNVLQFAGDGTPNGVFIGSIGQPEGVAITENGSLLIGNGAAGKVIKYEADGTFIEELIPSQPFSLLTPNAVILRSTSGLSAKNQDRYKHVNVVPNPGDKFELSSEIPIRAETVTIFDQSGKEVFGNQVDSAILWNAENAGVGVYTLRIKFENGDEIARKVMVTREKN